LYLWKAICLKNRGDLTDAVGVLDDGMAVCPQKLPLIGEKGLIQLKLGAFQPAFETCCIATIVAFETDRVRLVTETIVSLASVADIYGHKELNHTLRERVDWLDLSPAGKQDLDAAIHGAELSTDANMAVRYALQKLHQRLTQPSQDLKAGKLVASLREATLASDLDFQQEICNQLQSIGEKHTVSLLAIAALEFDPSRLQDDPKEAKFRMARTSLEIIRRIGNLDGKLAEQIFAQFVENRTGGEAKAANWGGVFSEAVETLKALGFLNTKEL